MLTEDPDDTNLELDLYGGVASEFGSSVGWDLGFIYYMYPSADSSDLDFVELYGGLSTELENGLALGGYLYWDPDNETVYLDTSAGFAGTDSFGVDATLALTWTVSTSTQTGASARLLCSRPRLRPALLG